MPRYVNLTEEQMQSANDVEGDPSWTLADWRDFIAELIDLHGTRAIMYTDGGYNNVSLRVFKPKTRKSNEDQGRS